MSLLHLLLGRSPLRALPVLLPLRGTGDEYDGGTGTRVLLKDGVGLVLRGLTVSDAGGVAAGDALKINGPSTVARATAQTDAIVGAARAGAANGAAVDIVLYGTVTATADAAVSAGDILGGPSVTAGRWRTRNTYTPTGIPTGTNAAPVASAICVATCNQNHPNLSAVAFTGTGLGGNAQNLGVVRGLAITAAAGAGSTFTLLVGPGGL